jgi:hypothetical protein
MKKILTLTASTYVRSGESLLLPDKLEIAFESPTYRLGTLLLNVENDEQSKQYKLSDNSPVDITAFAQKAGEVRISVALVIRGETVKKWSVEPIIVREVEQTYELVPEIEQMKRENAEMQAQLAEMRKAFAEIVTLVRESESI